MTQHDLACLSMTQHASPHPLWAAARVAVAEELVENNSEAPHV